jgi:hypothetical protein
MRVGTKRCANVYERGDRTYVDASSITTGGVWVASPPFIVVDAAVSAQVGAAVAGALAGSKAGFPHPARSGWDKLEEPLYELAGVRTWAQFVRGSRYCLVEAVGGVLRLIPSINRGARDGFKLLRSEAEEVPEDLNADDLGGRLRATLSKCRNSDDVEETGEE